MSYCLDIFCLLSSRASISNYYNGGIFSFFGSFSQDLDLDRWTSKTAFLSGAETQW